MLMGRRTSGSWSSPQRMWRNCPGAADRAARASCRVSTWVAGMICSLSTTCAVNNRICSALLAAANTIRIERPVLRDRPHVVVTLLRGEAVGHDASGVEPGEAGNAALYGGSSDLEAFFHLIM